MEESNSASSSALNLLSNVINPELKCYLFMEEAFEVAGRSKIRFASKVSLNSSTVELAMHTIPMEYCIFEEKLLKLKGCSFQYFRSGPHQYKCVYKCIGCYQVVQKILEDNSQSSPLPDIATLKVLSSGDICCDYLHLAGKGHCCSSFNNVSNSPLQDIVEAAANEWRKINHNRSLEAARVEEGKEYSKVMKKQKAAEQISMRHQTYMYISSSPYVFKKVKPGLFQCRNCLNLAEKRRQLGFDSPKHGSMFIEKDTGLVITNSDVHICQESNLQVDFNVNNNHLF